MNELTEFQQRAAAVAVAKLFAAGHFSICDLDNIAKLMHRTDNLAGHDYTALRALHCVNWSDMGIDLKRMTQEKCLEILGLPQKTVEMAQEVKTDPKPEPRVRLAFWR